MRPSPPPPPLLLSLQTFDTPHIFFEDEHVKALDDVTATIRGPGSVALVSTLVLPVLLHPAAADTPRHLETCVHLPPFVWRTIYDLCAQQLFPDGRRYHHMPMLARGFCQAVDSKSRQPQRAARSRWC